MIDTKKTAQTKARYQRIAPFYNRMEAFSEGQYHDWRSQLWERVKGPRVLEVGVGTGKNMAYYPNDVEIMAIDLTPGMLAQAEKRAAELAISVNLRLGDVQALEFADATFDEAVATFVFCSVPDPILGLKELARVVKPGGRLFLLEHMRSANAAIGVLMDVLNPVVVRMVGANINRRTLENVVNCGWQLEQVADMGMGGIFKMIIGARHKD